MTRETVSRSGRAWSGLIVAATCCFAAFGRMRRYDDVGGILEVGRHVRLVTNRKPARFSTNRAHAPLSTEVLPFVSYLTARTLRP